MKSALLTQILIGLFTLLILVVVGRRKIFDQPRLVALFFLAYFMDNLIITLTNCFPGLQFTPNHLWEGFLLWGWSGKTYSIVSILFLLCIVRSFLQFEKIGLTFRQQQGSIVPSSFIIFLIALGSLTFGVLYPKGKFDLQLLFYLAILPGLNEELVYRGVLFACLDRLFPKNWLFASAKIGWSIVTTTILFGLLHGVWLDDQLGLHIEIAWVRNALLSGFIFSWLRERTGSLIMPIFAHGTWDFFLFLPRMM